MWWIKIFIIASDSKGLWRAINKVKVCGHLLTIFIAFLYYTVHLMNWAAMTVTRDASSCRLRYVDPGNQQWDVMCQERGISLERSIQCRWTLRLELCSSTRWRLIVQIIQQHLNVVRSHTFIFQQATSSEGAMFLSCRPGLCPLPTSLARRTSRTGHRPAG